MDHHEILAPALQKYYSALKSLSDFGKQGDFFDDIANLDKFFSEFRNITFVIQKGLGTAENKAIYTQLRTEYLCGDTMKWFVETRNKTTKEKPFELKKALHIDIYLHDGIIRLINDQMTVNIDSSFNDVLDYIRETFFQRLKLTEIYFTSHIIFKEANSDIEIYPKLKQGIIQMDAFLHALEDHFQCACPVCLELRKKVSGLLIKIQSKELLFVSDYSLENGKELTVGDKAEMYVSTNKTDSVKVSDMRLPLDNLLYNDVKDCLVNLFQCFISMHMAIYQMQHDIMPVFMVVYGDHTHRMIPFIATSKATFYRRVAELIAMPDFSEVEAVFYCGEYYMYNIEQFQSIKELPYSDRIKNAKKEMIAFTMIAKGGSEMSLELDETNIHNMEYISEQLKRAEFAKVVSAPFDWLNPIRIKLRNN